MRSLRTCKNTKRKQLSTYKWPTDGVYDFKIKPDTDLNSFTQTLFFKLWKQKKTFSLACVQVRVCEQVSPLSACVCVSRWVLWVCLTSCQWSERKSSPGSRRCFSQWGSVGCPFHSASSERQEESLFIKPQFHRMLHTGGSGLGQVNLRLKLGQMHKIRVFFKTMLKLIF